MSLSKLVLLAWVHLPKALPIHTPLHHHRLGVSVHNMRLLHFFSHLYHMTYFTIDRSDPKLAIFFYTAVRHYWKLIFFDCCFLCCFWHRRLSPTKDPTPNEYSFIWTKYKIWSSTTNCTLVEIPISHTQEEAKEFLFELKYNPAIICTYVNVMIFPSYAHMHMYILILRY